ncbi:MAG TPA: Gfo/Idh/MocA family oxidoreductase [Bryobacteraceae bacterium]|jgi:predicted dehydrogenase
MKIAVLGLGFMGSTHLKALRSIPEATLCAVFSNDERALEGDLSHIQGNLGGPGERFDFTAIKKYRDVGALLADPEIDAVDICLPTFLHAPVALQALRGGKHVLVEKPLALTGADADELLAEARRRNLVLMSAQVLRFFSQYRVLRDTLPALGHVRHAFFRRRCAAPVWSKWLHDKSKSGGGVFDLLIHDIDVALWLFGLPSRVSAIGSEDLERGIDLLTATLFYADGSTVTISGGWHHPKSYPFSMEYTVVADGGTIEYSSAGRPPTLYKADGSETPLELAEADGYVEEIRYFVQCATANRRPELCPPESSVEAVKLALLLDKARDKNGEIIPCHL